MRPRQWLRQRGPSASAQDFDGANRKRIEHDGLRVERVNTVMLGDLQPDRTHEIDPNHTAISMMLR